MLNPDGTILGLSIAGCRARQQRLTERLRSLGFDAAVIVDRRHVYYFSGYWSATFHAPILVIFADGAVHAVLPEVAGAPSIAADRITHYESQRLGTLVDDQFGSASHVAESIVAAAANVGCDLPHLAIRTRAPVNDLSTLVLALRRAKDADEVELIRHAVRACEAGYARAANIVRPGIREIDIYAEVHAAAVKELGEPIGELGNDFQSGTPGGSPRLRAVQAGELMPLDVAIAARGYRCDLCRTFAVGGEPTSAQVEAGRLVCEALAMVEREAAIGVSCRDLYEIVRRTLDGRHGWKFFHHLGHGTGLGHHEAPRLNPHWDDSLEVGDLFTVEPGLYHDDLRGGVRLEQNYWLTTQGLVRLSNYPLGW